MNIEPLSPRHAAEAASLHLEGQPGTFLSELGLRFLTVLYGEIARTPAAFGFVAQENGRAVGVAMATESTSDLFRHLLWRRPLRLVWAALPRLIQHLGLLLRAVRTLAYPSQDAGLFEPELLFIGVRSELRSQGLGRQLLLALCQDGGRRDLPGLKVMVEAANPVANAFYQSCGFVYRTNSTLYGRLMNWYELALPVSKQVSGENRA